jgi:tetratricopeptide (TPR) repeat protein
LKKALEFHKKAISIYEENDTNSIDLAIAYNNLGLTLGKMNENEKAIVYFFKTLDIFNRNESLKESHPYFAYSYNNLAMAYHNLKMYNKALIYHKKTIDIRENRINPELGMSYGNIAQTYNEKKQFPIALFYLKKNIEVFKSILPEGHPYHEKARKQLLSTYHSRAVFNLNENNFQSALYDFDTLTQTYFKDSSKVWIGLGKSNYRLENYSKALKNFQHALLLDTLYQEKEYFKHIGLIFLKLSNYHKAKEFFKKYSKLYPNQSSAHKNWAMFYALQNQKYKSIISLKKAIELGYNDLDFLENDDSLDNIRKKRAFKKLIRQVKKQHKE